MTRGRLIWWVFFLLATVALSEAFHASRLLASETPGANPWSLLFWGAVLLASFIILGYDGYAKSKVENKVAHRIWFYEKVYQIQNGEKPQ